MYKSAGFMIYMKLQLLISSTDKKLQSIIIHRSFHFLLHGGMKIDIFKPWKSPAHPARSKSALAKYVVRKRAGSNLATTLSSGSGCMTLPKYQSSGTNPAPGSSSGGRGMGSATVVSIVVLKVVANITGTVGSGRGRGSAALKLLCLRSYSQFC